MSKKIIAIISVIALVLIYLAYNYFSTSNEDEVYLTSKVKKGDFISEVIAFDEAQSTSFFLNKMSQC